MPRFRSLLVASVAIACSLALLAQAPAPAADTFTFLHASDPHTNQSNLRHLERVRHIVLERKPAFVVMTGDLVADALRVGETEARGQFELYKKTIDTFPVPVRSVLGNHDVFGIEREASNVRADHPLYGKRMFEHYLGARFYSFDYGQIHFVVLDTIGVDGPNYYGHVDADELSWLERDLARVPAGSAVVAVTHIPLMTGMLGHWGYREDLGSASTLVEVRGRRVFRHVVGNTADVLARFANVRLSLVLGGHIHARERLEFITSGRRLRIHQAASVVPPFDDAIRMVSGVTLYRVSGTDIDDGEFIRMD